MKLRLLPILLSISITSVVLFGGWFAYQSLAKENPMVRIVQEENGVKKANVKFEKTEVLVRLELEDQASLREIFEHISTEGASVIGDRKLNIKVTNTTSKQLEQIWSGMLFNIAEAMETKQYSAIPKTLKQVQTDFPQVKAISEMDDTNVYIRLTDGKRSKYVILPRIPARMEAWTNE